MKSAHKVEANDGEAKKKAAIAAATPVAALAATGTTTAVVDLNDDEKVSDLSNRQLHRYDRRM